MYNHNVLRAKIRYQCDCKGITLKKMLSDLGYNVNILTQATGNKGISSSTLYAIADYLEVSVDFLLGRTDNPKSHTITADMQRDYENTIGRLLQVAKDNPESRERMEKVLDKIIDMVALQIE